MTDNQPVSSSTARDSLPLAVAVVVPEGDQDALRHYPASGNNAVVVAQEVTPPPSTTTKACAALVIFFIAVGSVMLVFAGSPDYPSSEPFTSPPIQYHGCEGNLEESLRALDASVVTDLDCEGPLGKISTELGKFTALTSLR
jgi:hypothetical protein